MCNEHQSVQIVPLQHSSVKCVHSTTCQTGVGRLPTVVQPCSLWNDENCCDQANTCTCSKADPRSLTTFSLGQDGSDNQTVLLLLHLQQSFPSFTRQCPWSGEHAHGPGSWSTSTYYMRTNSTARVSCCHQEVRTWFPRLTSRKAITCTWGLQLQWCCLMYYSMRMYHRITGSEQISHDSMQGFGM
jgi:hypothetical protein